MALGWALVVRRCCSDRSHGWCTFDWQGSAVVAAFVHTYIWITFVYRIYHLWCYAIINDFVSLKWCSLIITFVNWWLTYQVLALFKRIFKVVLTWAFFFVWNHAGFTLDVVPWIYGFYLFLPTTWCLLIFLFIDLRRSIIHSKINIWFYWYWFY